MKSQLVLKHRRIIERKTVGAFKTNQIIGKNLNAQIAYINFR